MKCKEVTSVLYILSLGFYLIFYKLSDRYLDRRNVNFKYCIFNKTLVYTTLIPEGMGMAITEVGQVRSIRSRPATFIRV